MFYSTLTLRFDPARGGFDDQPLDEFSRSRELLSVKAVGPPARPLRSPVPRRREFPDGDRLG